MWPCSKVFITIVEGNFNYNNIDLGPDLGGDPFDGFRVTGTGGFGNGQGGEFDFTYTLSGGSFFAYFALDFAKIPDLDSQVDIYISRNINKLRP